MQMLRHAYLVLAHNNPTQLARLLSRLNSPQCWFFVHIDKKAPLEQFRPVFENPLYKIIPVERERTNWGGPGIVLATLNGLRQICSDPGKFDFVHLVSGSDYPIASNQEIDAFFSRHQNKSFIDYFPLPTKFWQNGGMPRLEWYHFIRIQHYSRWKWYALMAVNKCISAVPIFRRKLPTYVAPFGGSQWWSISSAAAAYILRFVDEHRDYVHYHRHTLAPDECFFQTILANAHDKIIRDNLVNDNLRFIVWHKLGVKKFPLVLGLEELDAMKASGKLWARKFVLDGPSEVLDALDRYSNPAE